MEKLPIRMADKIVDVNSTQKEQWNEFINWVASTKLFQAIRVHDSGTEIRGHGPDGDINFSLILNKMDRTIYTPEDLPAEILLNFYQNSPYYNKPDYEIQKLLTNEY